MVGVEVMVSLGQPIDKGGGFAIGDRPNFDPAAERTDFKVHSIPQELVDTVRNRFAVTPGSDSVSVRRQCLRLISGRLSRNWQSGDRPTVTVPFRCTRGGLLLGCRIWRITSMVVQWGHSRGAGTAIMSRVTVFPGTPVPRTTALEAAGGRWGS
jgi:hypothetical protein